MLVSTYQTMQRNQVNEVKIFVADDIEVQYLFFEITIYILKRLHFQSIYVIIFFN